MFRRSSQHLAQATLGPQSDLKRKIGGFLTEFDALSVSLGKSRNVGNLFEVSYAPRCGERMMRGPKLREYFIVGFRHKKIGMETTALVGGMKLFRLVVLFLSELD